MPRWIPWLLGGLVVWGSASAAPSLVLVVRHAERAAEPAGDPTLTPEGAERAALLAQIGSDAGIDAIVTSHWRRTQETAAPLARARGLTPQVVAIRKGELPAHVAEVAAAVQRLSGRVLVVGHSNTVAEIVKALSGRAVPAPCENQFGWAYVVQPVVDAGGSAAVMRLQYGAPNPVCGEH
ncbi:phosphoglycerate mutase family protein [Inhella crocodyli]|nr:phosphoglycerate mutase family protein [Inhella crocodyli]